MEIINDPTGPVLSESDPQAPELFGEKVEAKKRGRRTRPIWQMLERERVSFFELPLLEQLHRRPYHLLKVWGQFDLVKLSKNNEHLLLRTETHINLNNKAGIDRLMFKLEDDVLVVYEWPNMMIYAPTAAAALKAKTWVYQYREEVEEEPGFQLISLSEAGPETRLVPIKQAAPVTEDDLKVHYGDDFIGWEQGWLERMRQRQSGLTILHGPPGCGKTSYLRGLMLRMIKECAFYYIHASAFALLTSPGFVSFWMDQPGNKQRVAIMEDSENLLLPRVSGVDSDVSNLLNMGDGFLGEHLKLQVIATTNSPIRQLDSALLRPGRLIGSREFKRLSLEEAGRVAVNKGLVLPDQKDFSLAEIYCSPTGGNEFNPQRKMGFN